MPFVIVGLQLFHCLRQYSFNFPYESWICFPAIVPVLLLLLFSFFCCYHFVFMLIVCVVNVLFFFVICGLVVINVVAQAWRQRSGQSPVGERGHGARTRCSA